MGSRICISNTPRLQVRGPHSGQHGIPCPAAPGTGDRRPTPPSCTGNHGVPETALGARLLTTSSLCPQSWAPHLLPQVPAASPGVSCYLTPSRPILDRRRGSRPTSTLPLPAPACGGAGPSLSVRSPALTWSRPQSWTLTWSPPADQAVPWSLRTAEALLLTSCFQDGPSALSISPARLCVRVPGPP